MLDVDAIAEIQAYARTHDVSMGKAASELIRRGAKFRLSARMVNDIPVLDVPADFPSIPPGMVSGGSDEE